MSCLSTDTYSSGSTTGLISPVLTCALKCLRDSSQFITETPQRWSPAAAASKPPPHEQKQPFFLIFPGFSVCFGRGLTRKQGAGVSVQSRSCLFVKTEEQ